MSQLLVVSCKWSRPRISHQNERARPDSPYSRVTTAGCEGTPIIRMFELLLRTVDVRGPKKGNPKAEQVTPGSLT